ncbi:hypothetical protein AJ78_02831 [Emergomyces pasteurianus Ep9510]|uniref:LYC1 C-terminal domain-containing protein n=1 Tax=Emergomyces pasteurianus Ep9510 TaxID=1447872 RepID=A0A1J9QMA8_9EURO|nr:hypothetical protein AJ78_02831 [Emergomyces pasteurianus Ep9510]
MNMLKMIEPQSITIDGTEGLEVLSFCEATTPEQQVKCFKIVGASFGWPLPEMDYIEREKFLTQRPLADGSGTGVRWWYLGVQARDDPGPVIAACKTLHRDLLIRTAVGGTREAQGYCIGAVATDERYRRLGLAEFLLRTVAKWMDGPGGADASMLYSSIGKYYTNKGWRMLPAVQSVLSASHSLTFPNRSDLPPTQPLLLDDIPALCARDIEGIKTEFAKLKPAETEILMTVLPTANIVGWLQDRAAFISSKTNGDVPPVKGAICKDAKTWVYWHHDFPDQELTIQRVVISSQTSEDEDEEHQKRATAAIASLLLAALCEVQKWKLHKLVIWSPTPELHRAMHFVQEHFGVEVMHEERVHSNVPSVRWRGGDEDNTSQVVISQNEYYAWS